MAKSTIVGFVTLFVGTLSAPAHAQLNSRALELGQKQIDRLKPIEDAEPETISFEVQLGIRAVGLGELSLKPVEVEGKKVFEFRHALAVKIPNGPQMTALARAQLEPNLRPIRFDNERTLKLPDGSKQSTRHEGSVENNLMRVAVTIDGNTSDKKIKVPSGPFVHAVEALALRLDPSAQGEFAVTVLDVEAGEPFTLQLKWGYGDDRKPRLSVSRDGENEDEFFLFDKGRLNAYGKVTPPFVERRVTKAQFDEVRRLLSLE